MFGGFRSILTSLMQGIGIEEGQGNGRFNSNSKYLQENSAL
jgi:hypothetical protein